MLWIFAVLAQNPVGFLRRHPTPPWRPLSEEIRAFGGNPVAFTHRGTDIRDLGEGWRVFID